MTIGHLMAGTFVCVLAIAAVVLAWQSPDPNRMFAAVAFDLIMLPVIVALMVLYFMSPGQPRNWVIAGLCSTPILVSIAGSIVMYPIMIGWKAIHPLSWSSVIPLIIACQFLIFVYNAIVSQIRSRCPRCGGRRFKVESRMDPIKRMWLPTGLHICKNCGQRIRIVVARYGRSHVEPANPELSVQFSIQTGPYP
jgi:hypothetical protein